MMIERKTVVPLVLAALACLSLVAFVSHGIAVIQFDLAVGTHDIKPENMPALTSYFRLSHPFWWVPSVVCAGWSGFLISRPTCRAASLAWFLAASGIAVVLWATFCVLSIYLLRTTVYVGI